MANHKSALKRIRQTETRRQRNRHILSGMRTTIKRFRLAIESNDSDAAAESFTQAARAIRKAATKGVIPNRRADRTVGRLAKTLNTVSKG